LCGQRETNQLQVSSMTADQSLAQPHDDIYAIAFDFGWQSRLEVGSYASAQVTFEIAEPDLEKRWNQKHAAQDRPWKAAREVAKDAWNQVYDALTETHRTDSQAT